jgi:hypothetical protein
VTFSRPITEDDLNGFVDYQNLSSVTCLTAEEGLDSEGGGNHTEGASGLDALLVRRRRPSDPDSRGDPSALPCTRRTRLHARFARGVFVRVLTTLILAATAHVGANGCVSRQQR